jgi:AraC-like DNA-binding protein
MKAPVQLVFHSSLEKDIQRMQGTAPGFYHELSFCKAEYLVFPEGRVTVQEVTGTDYAVWQWNFHVKQVTDCFIKAEQGTILLLQPIEATDVELTADGKTIRVFAKMYLFFYLPKGIQRLTINRPSGFFIFIQPPLSFLEGLRKELPGMNELCQAFLQQQTRVTVLPIVPMLEDNWMRLKRIDVPTLKQGIPDLQLRKYMIDVLHDYGKTAKEQPRSELVFATTKHKAILLKEFLLEQLPDPELYTLKGIAKKFYAEPRTLTLAFQQLTGKTILQFILDRRMEKAHGYIMETALPINEIVFRCGFNDVSHFIRSYRKRYGKTPGRMRKET